MLEILRWFFGFSEFKIEGDVSSFIAKFRRNIWMVQKNGVVVTSRCFTRDYKYLKNESIYCGCFITKFRDFGFLNFLKRYRFRFGLFVGVILFFLTMFISNLFVWNVEVNGNILIPDEQIFKVCDENGLHFGAFIGKVDEKDIEFKLKEKFPQISWVSLNRVAGKYMIEINESKIKPNIATFEDEPCDVISNFDGEIIYVEAYAGNPLVSAGDIVKKGQVLVSGIHKIKGKDDVVFSHSDAKIIAKVHRTNEIHCKKIGTVNQKTGIQKTEKKLCLFGLKLPIKINRKVDKIVRSEEKYEPLEFLGIRFPVLMQTTKYDIYEKINLSGDIKKIKRVLAKEQKNWELTELVGNKILNRVYDFEETKDDVILKAYLTVEQRIDEKAPVNVDDLDSNILKKYHEN